ncbi:MAG TPA: EAL domain-containing protein [bacterium]|nr:EAL domain-containing protein [bacterium]
MVEFWKHLLEVSRYDPEQDLDRWREQLFTIIYPLALVVGLALCALTIHDAFASDAYLATILAVTVYGIAMTVMALRRIPVRIRMGIGLMIFFSSVFFQSSPVVGYLSLFSLPPLIALLVSFNAAISALVANTILFTLLSYHFLHYDLDIIHFGVDSMERWVLYGIVFLFLDLIITLCFGLLTKGLAQIITLEREARRALNEKERHLEEANARLANEALQREHMKETLSETERKAIFYISHDRLTNLPNRDSFIQRLGVEIMKARNRGQLFAAMAIGIDKFKHINSIYGTPGGDAILAGLAERLRGIVRDHDVVGRFGDDRFMVLFSDIARVEDTLNVVQKVWEAVERPFQIVGQEVRISASMGLCFFPLDAKSPEELVKNAETAMFAVKESGGGAHRFFDEKLNTDMTERVTIERMLRDAVTRDEFVPYFQPKVDRYGYLLGMESLIRWNSSNGLIMPSHFIPIAEQNGSIVDIGERILYHSCRQNRAWQDDGFVPKKVSVNLSPFEFRHPDLIRRIRDTIEKSGLDPMWLELEITESGIVRNEKDAIVKLTELHEMGVTLSIDDFGTGYSSLSKLKDYPLDTLKIDKTFIDNLPTDKRAVTIVTSLIKLAHNLGFKVVAEGVERPEQLEFLILLGCDQFQGYLFSKPLTADEFESRLQRQVIMS